MKIRCYLFGHKLKFNFATLPNKAICARCKAKAKQDLHLLEWYPVDKFDGEKRTDDELIKKWVY